MKRPQKLAVMLVPTPPYEICGVGLAQEDGGRGVAVRDSFDIHGHIMILTVIIIG